MLLRRHLNSRLLVIIYIIFVELIKDKSVIQAPVGTFEVLKCLISQSEAIYNNYKPAILFHITVNSSLSRENRTLIKNFMA